MMKPGRAVWAAVVALGVIGCNPEPGPQEEEQSVAIAHHEEETSGPRLYVFNCGTLSYEDISAFGLTNADTPVRALFVPCYLIEYKGKKIVWDAGLPLNLVGLGVVHNEEAQVDIRYDVSFIDQLAALDILPEDIDYLIMSHLHVDHAGAANAFKNSIWIVQKAEHTLAFSEDQAGSVFDPSLYSDLKHSETMIIEGDHDVFGDGVLRIISAPGHTPGHQTLLLQLENTGPVMLSGDLYHFRASRKLKSTPVWNTNREQSLESMARVEEILAETGATLWIEHDLALAESLNLAPAYYD